MIVPRLIASSIGNNVSPGTFCKKKKKESPFVSKRATVPRWVEKWKGDDACTYPAILLRLLLTLAVLAQPDDDVEAIVASIQALSVALRAIADEGKRIVF